MSQILSLPSVLRPVAILLPGLALTSTLVGLAVGLRQLPFLDGLSPLILALTLGLVWRNALGVPLLARPGVAFSLRRVLRFAVVLLGLQLSLQQVVDVGVLGMMVIAVTLGTTYLVTLLLGRLFSVDRKLCHLIAAGTSICGASAVLATNTVTEAEDEDVAYAVGVVTVFGTLSMLIYPLLPELLALSPKAFGMWAGASIHEVAQVIGAAFQNGPISGEFATISKLSRVLFLAPVVALLGFAVRRNSREGVCEPKPRVRVPGFVIGFAALCLLNSFVPMPAVARTWVAFGNQLLLALALAAMGLETDVWKLAAKGMRPLALGATVWLFIAVLSYLLVQGAGY